MIDKDAAIEGIHDFFTGPRKRIAYLSCALVVMTLAALVIFIVQKTRKQKTPPAERELVINQKLLVPDGPGVQKGYVTSRPAKDRWDESDAERWLTIPSKKELDDLGRTNDQIVSDITGAAP